MVYYVNKVKYDIPRTPYGWPHWFRTTNDWFYWRRPRTLNAFKLKNAVDAQFRVELERRSNPLAYHASLVCQRQTHNHFNGEAISNYFSSTSWAEVMLDKDLSDDDCLYVTATAMLDLIYMFCHNEVRMDLTYGLYSLPTPRTWGVPSIVTRKRKATSAPSDNLTIEVILILANTGLDVSQRNWLICCTSNRHTLGLNQTCSLNSTSRVGGDLPKGAFQPLGNSMTQPSGLPFTNSVLLLSVTTFSWGFH